MDSLLDFSVPGVRGFLLPHPIVVDTGEPPTDDTYPYRGAPGRAEARVPFSGNWVRWARGKIPSALIQS
jgi:hypothetical protein